MAEERKAFVSRQIDVVPARFGIFASGYESGPTRKDHAQAGHTKGLPHSGP